MSNNEPPVTELPPFLGPAYLVLADFARREGIEVFKRFGAREGGFRQLFWKVQPYAITDIFRLRSVVQYLQTCLHLEGQMIECGVYKGGTSLLIASVLKRSRAAPRKLYMLDAFEGLPRPDRAVDRAYTEGTFKSDPAELARAIDALGLTGICEIRKGLFKDTLPGLAARERFMFAHIDGDLYASTVDCITHLHGSMVHGAPMVFDDYYDESGGVMRAVHEHVARTGELIHLGPVGQATVIKGMTARDARSETLKWKVPVGNGTALVDVSLENLWNVPGYVAFVHGVRKSLAGQLRAVSSYDGLFPPRPERNRPRVSRQAET